MAEIFVHTGQHYDEKMSSVFFDELSLPEPHYNLGIGSGSHGAQTGRMLESIESVLQKELPDAVLVFGDTNSTVAAGLAATKLHLPLAHVEAGLRSFNRRMPEEINRVVTDHLSDWLFAPTTEAVTNLTAEGVKPEKIFLVGDVMLDAAQYFAQRPLSVRSPVRSICGGEDPYILATIHRAENTDAPLRLAAIHSALESLAQEITVVLPLHPRTAAKLPKHEWSHVKVIDPVGYVDMIHLEKSAELIVTDSGGVQKEAFFHQVPCVTLRDETEWVELVAGGWNRIVPPSSAEDIIAGARSALGSVGADVTPYGNGSASITIVQTIINELRSQ